jgi:hypothetical protein
LEKVSSRTAKAKIGIIYFCRSASFSRFLSHFGVVSFVTHHKIAESGIVASLSKPLVNYDSTEYLQMHNLK